ncbi:isoprenylcysteine carboxylmethyltransferase family protein [Mycobacterium sp.]|uniref:methyltransferase family protein n=1 Tax=Mycobacterium sp. TaxID=1785 RepID=UPI002D67D55B|nr:isoprenylcysteine carboxylmethyltransferase family protein [Mycobacterium sp.]HZA10715.1 isoprenylcysteine carboxylmethyltransferase family protein [Mycobacterium sp.]
MRIPVLITVVLWLAGELVLRARQRRHAEPVVTREWRTLGAIWGCAVAGGMLAGVLAAHLRAVDLPLHRTTWTVVGLVVAWCGIGLRWWSVATLGRHFHPTVQIQQRHELVRSGPYRVLRHPAYSGLLLALFGFSLPFANLAAIVVYNGFIVAAVLYRIRVEERVLLDGLGDRYAEYMRGTYRLVPGIW